MAGPPPEDPTRRLTPATPPPVTPSELAYVEGDPVTSRAALLDDLRSLKRWLALVGLIALAALGVGLYTLLSSDEDGDGRGASRATVRALDDRVDELENEVRDRATKSSVSELREDQQALGDRVDEVSRQAGQGADEESVQDTVDELSRQIETLEGRIDAVEQTAGDTGGQDDGTP